MRLATTTRHPIYDLIVIGIITTLLFGALLGARPYSAPSESRYIEIGREMAETGDYITPRLNYVKYFEKPPLFYWVQAAWTEIAGTGFGVSRAPTAFFAVLLCMLTYGLGRMLHGRLTGLLSALIIATSLYLFALSRVVLLDVPVSVFLVATLTAFLYAINAPPGKKRDLALFGMYAAAAGAVMTKGLIGIVLPGGVIFLWFACTGSWNRLKEMRLVSGTLFFLLLTAPWHIVVWQHNPEHPWFYFIHEHWLRYTTKIHGRDHPIWFFVAVLVGGLFPWIVFAFPALRAGLKGAWANRKTNGTRIFLALWIGFIFLFFSASDSKLIPYILPIFPPIAVMIGNYLTYIWREKTMEGFRKNAGFGLGMMLMMILLVAIAIMPMILSATVNPTSKIMVTITQGGDEAQLLSAFALVALIALFIGMVQGRNKHVIILFTVIAMILTQLGDLLASKYNKDSMAEFADIIKPYLEQGAEIANYDRYYQDLPIYLKRPITVARWRGELLYGTQHEDTSKWMIDYEEFWKRWNTPGHRMLAVLREDAFNRIRAEKPNLEAAHIYPMLQQGENMLISNFVPEQSKPEKKQ